MLKNRLLPLRRCVFVPLCRYAFTPLRPLTTVAFFDRRNEVKVVAKVVCAVMPLRLLLFIILVTPITKYCPTR
jgi:hypothetical protein